MHAAVSVPAGFAYMPCVGSFDTVALAVSHSLPSDGLCLGCAGADPNARPSGTHSLLAHLAGLVSAEQTRSQTPVRPASCAVILDHPGWMFGASELQIRRPYCIRLTCARDGLFAESADPSASLLSQSQPFVCRLRCLPRPSPRLSSLSTNWVSGAPVWARTAVPPWGLIRIGSTDQLWSACCPVRLRIKRDWQWAAAFCPGGH